MQMLAKHTQALSILSRVGKHPARRPRPGDGGFFSLLLELILLEVAT
jgi:hypothetical protein